jgi:subtilisin family serine protease
MLSSPGHGSDSYVPFVSKPAWVDRNNNGIADTLDREIAGRLANGTAQGYVNVTVELKSAPTAYDAGAFVSCGGYVTTSPWTYATYGFGGRIQYAEIGSFVRLDPDVLLVEKDVACQADLAYAAKQIGARPYVWSTVGLQGDPSTSIALLDTGVNPSSADFSPGYGNLNFSDKIVGWNDQVNNKSTPYDDNGHGSNTAGLAAGDGFFPKASSGNAIAQVSEDFGTISSTNTYLISGMMVNKTGTITVSTRWSNPTTRRECTVEDLYLFYGDNSESTSSWTEVAGKTTPSMNTWYSLSYVVTSIPSSGYAMYHIVMTLGSGSGTLYDTFNMSWPYTPPSDGFQAWTGIAPQSKLVEVKVLNSAGSGTSTELINGINWVIAHAKVYHITVVSMSLGFSSEVATVDTAVENLVNAGITTVCAAGNNGSGGNHIFTPGSVDTVITVAAMNEFDNITSYSSQGGTSQDGGHTIKPDITAPGGSFYAVPTFSASNYSGYAAPMQGTSMATPIVAGAVDIVQQAMGGYKAWNWTEGQALMPKMILLMTATETYPNLREDSTSAYSPTLNRGGKNAHEGYGRLNLDAAVDAVLKNYQVGTNVSGTLGVPPTPSNVSVLGQRLAWARNVQLVSGVKYNFTLSVPSGADFDLYLYNTTGDAYGQPVILANSTKAAVGGFESITYTPSATGEYYIVVKRDTESTGGGTFSLTSSPKPAPYLLLTVQPNQANYARGQSLSFTVDVLNQPNPALVSTLTLTVTGPNGYYYFDFQNASVAADFVGEYSFSWSIPDVAGTYVVEVSLVPAQLTAYDAMWLKVV